MSKKNIDHSVESRVCFEQLEEWVREQIQFYVQGFYPDLADGSVKSESFIRISSCRRFLGL